MAIHKLIIQYDVLPSETVLFNKKKMWDESNQLSKRAVPYQNGDRLITSLLKHCLNSYLTIGLTLSNDVKRQRN